MLHPSYSDLMNIANSEVEQGEQPVVNSRYSIVLATAKRARQIIATIVYFKQNFFCKCIFFSGCTSNSFY